MIVAYWELSQSSYPSDHYKRKLKEFNKGVNLLFDQKMTGKEQRNLADRLKVEIRLKTLNNVLFVRGKQELSIWVSNNEDYDRVVEHIKGFL